MIKFVKENFGLLFILAVIFGGIGYGIYDNREELLITYYKTDLDSFDRDARIHAINKLAQMGTDRAVEELRKAARREDAHVREHLCIIFDVDEGDYKAIMEEPEYAVFNPIGPEEVIKCYRCQGQGE